MDKETKLFYKLLCMKSIAIMGYTFFSSLIVLQLIGIDKIIYCLYTAFVGAGLYFFSELIKYYGIQPNSKVTNKTYNFII